jgi:hypothetical protein
MNDVSVLQVVQIPVIQQNLLAVKEQVIARVEAVKNMAVTDENRKQAKDIRAELNKERAAFDEQLKQVKAVVMKPYDELVATYKECITVPYSEADEVLKTSIAEIEDSIKAEKRKDVEAYFNEYAEVVRIDFVKFENVGLNISLSASVKSLKKQVRDYLNKVAAEIDSLLSMENKEELFSEYKRNGYNLALAITTVDDRHKRIESEKQKVAEAMQQKQVDETVVAKVAEVVAPPEIAKIEDTEVYTLNFTVRGTKAQLKELKNFLNNGGYDYE